MTWQREKIKVKLTTGEVYNFVTEPDSHYKTVWDYYEINDDLIISNSNGSSFKFPKINVVFLKTPNCFNLSSTVKISKLDDCFEVNDYVKTEETK